MSKLRKTWMPWTAADQVSSDEEFQALLDKQLKFFWTLRMVALFPAAICVLGGYLMENRPLMLASVVPLALILLFSKLMDKTEAAMPNQREQ